jgi:hypothetical protein
MPFITMTSERTGHWTKMHRPFVPFSESGISSRTRYSADCITITSGFRFSVHTAALSPQQLVFGGPVKLGRRVGIPLGSFLNNRHPHSGRSIHAADPQRGHPAASSAGAETAEAIVFGATGRLDLNEFGGVRPFAWNRLCSEDKFWAVR